jgi:hypothetical protein
VLSIEVMLLAVSEFAFKVASRAASSGFLVIPSMNWMKRSP